MDSLARINRQAIDRITGKWVEFIDNGEEYVDQKHQYSVDLDIFGQASVFQWINNTFTFLGRKFLKNALTVPDIETRTYSTNILVMEKQSLEGHFHTTCSGFKTFV